MEARGCYVKGGILKGTVTGGMLEAASIGARGNGMKNL